MNKPRSRYARRAATIIILALIFIVVLCIVFSYLQGRQPQNAGQNAAPGQTSAQDASAGGNAGARNAVVVRTVAVENGAIENTILINGDILTGRDVSIYPTVAGKLSDLRLKIGDTVARGQVVALVDPSRPGEVFSQSPIPAPISGVIMSSPVAAGNTVSTTTAIYTVGDLSNLLVETFVPERYVSSLQKGLPAAVSLEAFPDETFVAVVDEVSPVLDPSSRTLRIRLKFNQRDNRVKAGMFAQVSLVTHSRTDVKVVPRDALINTYGSYIVFTVDDGNRARRKEIALGLESESMVEIAEGLALGEKVIVAGQNFLSDGDLVRVVEQL
ncbi:MAG: efflux RND transporter periplasmic adaptor subunit [Treponema sp.]|jgi:multidrug efflux pump subunit AcrA (membrane-fusion protein)|nr:efflux RND transporter periplasmic adaptor subunit [Treponema sp.]